jgi:hypothetical protein
MKVRCCWLPFYKQQKRATIPVERETHQLPLIWNLCEVEAFAEASRGHAEQFTLPLLISTTALDALLLHP